MQQHVCLSGYCIVIPSASPSPVIPSLPLLAGYKGIPQLISSLTTQHQQHQQQRFSSSTSSSSTPPPSLQELLPTIRNYFHDKLPSNYSLLATGPLIESIPFSPHTYKYTTTTAATFSSSSSSSSISSPPVYVLRCGILLYERSLLEYGSYAETRQAAANVLMDLPPLRLQSWLIMCLNYCSFDSVRQVLVPFPSTSSGGGGGEKLSSSTHNTTTSTTSTAHSQEQYPGWKKLHSVSSLYEHYLTVFQNRLSPWQQRFLGYLGLFHLSKILPSSVRFSSLPFAGTFAFTFDSNEIPDTENGLPHTPSSIYQHVHQTFQQLVRWGFVTSESIIDIPYIIIPSPLTDSSSGYRILVQCSPNYLSSSFAKFIKDCAILMFGSGFGENLRNSLRLMVVQLGGLSRVPFPKEPNVPFSLFVDYVHFQQYIAARKWYTHMQKVVQDVRNSLPVREWSIWKIYRALRYILDKSNRNIRNSNTVSTSRSSGEPIKNTAFRWRKAYPHDEPFIFGPVIPSDDSNNSNDPPQRTSTTSTLSSNKKSSSSSSSSKVRSYAYKYSLPYGSIYGLRQPLPHQTDLLAMYEHDDIQLRINPVAMYARGIYHAATCIRAYCLANAQGASESELLECKYWDMRDVKQTKGNDTVSSSGFPSSMNKSARNPPPEEDNACDDDIDSVDDDDEVEENEPSSSTNPSSHHHRDRSFKTTSSSSMQYKLPYHILSTIQLLHFILQLPKSTGEVNGTLRHRRTVWVVLIDFCFSVNALRLCYEFISQARMDPHLPVNEPWLSTDLWKAEDKLRTKLANIHGQIIEGRVEYVETNASVFHGAESSETSDHKLTKRRRKSSSLVTSTSGNDTTPQRKNVLENKLSTIILQVERCPPNVKTIKLRRLRYANAYNPLFEQLMNRIEGNGNLPKDDENITDAPITANYEDTIETTLISSKHTFSPALLNFNVGRRRVYYWCYDGLPGTVERITGERLLQFTNIRELLSHCKQEEYILDYLKQIVIYQPPPPPSLFSSSSSSLFSLPVLKHTGPERGLQDCLPSLGGITGYPELLAQEIPLFWTQNRVNGIQSPGSLIKNTLWVKEEKGYFISPPAGHAIPVPSVSHSLSSSSPYSSSSSSTSSSAALTYLRACHGENCLWNTLYSLFVVTSVTTQFEYAPVAKHPWGQWMNFNDYRNNIFLTCKAEPLLSTRRIAEELRSFTGCQLAQHLRAVFESLYGTRISHGRWDEFALTDLMDIVHSAGGSHLASIFTRMAENMDFLSFGLPDIVLWDSVPCTGCTASCNENDSLCYLAKERIARANANLGTVPHIALIEVKSQNDRITLHQFDWLEYLAQKGIPSSVVQVRSEANIKLIESKANNMRERNSNRIEQGNQKRPKKK